MRCRAPTTIAGTRTKRMHSARCGAGSGDGGRNSRRPARAQARSRRIGRSLRCRFDDERGRRVIGSAGFHGPPEDDGRVEIGYRVEPEYRQQGVATEVVRALFDWANREHGVTRFRAATAPDNVASQRVLARFGFRRTGAQIDDVDGLEFIYELDGWTATS